MTGCQKNHCMYKINPFVSANAVSPSPLFAKKIQDEIRDQSQRGKSRSEERIFMCVYFFRAKEKSLEITAAYTNKNRLCSKGLRRNSKKSCSFDTVLIF